MEGLGEVTSIITAYFLPSIVWLVSATTGSFNVGAYLKDLFPWSDHSVVLAVVVLTLVCAFAAGLYAQCCMQRKRPAITVTQNLGTGATVQHTSHHQDPLSLNSLPRSASRDSSFSEYSQNEKKESASPYNSFNNLVDLAKPLKHFGASIPVGTLQAAVNNLNDRLKYRMVTSKTHVGGGLSSIFVPEDERPPVAKSPSIALDDSFMEGFEYDSDEEKIKNLNQDVNVVSAVEQAFRRSEVLSWLPESIVKLLAKRCQLRTLEKGEVLFTANERKSPSASTFVVVSGEMSSVIPSTFFSPSVRATLMSANQLNGQEPAAFANVDDEDEDDHIAEEDVTLTITPGKTITGISDFIATIVGEPVDYVATSMAKSQCIVAEITHEQLEHLFDAHEGVREDLLQRSLALLQRVTFTSLYRLTGRYALSFYGNNNRSSRNLPTTAIVVDASSTTTTNSTAGNELSEWATAAATELGIAPSDLMSFAKEKRRKITLRRVRTGSFYKPQQDANEDASESGSFVADVASSSTTPASSSSEFPCIVTLADKETLPMQEVALHIVLSGCLEVRTLNFAGDKKGKLQYRARPSQAVGHMGVLTRTFAEWYHPRSGREGEDDEDYPCNTIVAVGETRLLRINEKDYFDLIERYPDIVVHRARQAVTRLAPLVRLVDLATYFILAQPGDAVIRQGELVDGLLVVLHGRVRFYQSNIGGREFGRGAVLGESSFLTNEPSMYSILTMRRTSLACVPKLVVRAVTAKYPDSLAHIGRTISKKMLAYASHDPFSVPMRSGDKLSDATKKRRAVAVVPVSPNVPTDSFIHALSAAINAQDIKCTVLSSGRGRYPDATSGGAAVSAARNLEFYGQHNADSPSATTLDEIEILSRMQDAEEANEIVLYQIDPFYRDDASKWSKLCIAQADSILLVVNASDRPLASPLEKRLRSVQSSARRELVMLHVMSDSEAPQFLPKHTREWIEELGEVVYGHHIRFHPYDFRLDTFHWKSDMRKLGRWITGNAIGLVLGGGGARGSAHLSVLKAFENLQIPIDFIGGTSIGAFVGGLYCMKGGDLNEVKKVFTQFAKEMSSLWLKIKDVTFPIVSYLKGYQFNRSIVRVFGDTNIEDFWTNFFCVSTDLTDSREIAHRNGFAWKYIRASMTLTGYLPPICDVQIENGVPVVHYLVDGGYIDNLPVDEMRKVIGRNGTVIAVDVQSEWKLRGEDYGEDLNGWWYLWRWLSPFHVTPAIPTASEIQSHLAYISCVQRFGKAMNEIPVDLYLAPPLGTTLTLDFALADKLQEITYPPLLEKLKEWLAERGKAKGSMKKAFLPFTTPDAALTTSPTSVHVEGEHHSVPRRSPASSDLGVANQKLATSVISTFSDEFVQPPKPE